MNSFIWIERRTRLQIGKNIEFSFGDAGGAAVEVPEIQTREGVRYEHTVLGVLFWAVITPYMDRGLRLPFLLLVASLCTAVAVFGVARLVLSAHWRGSGRRWACVVAAVLLGIGLWYWFLTSRAAAANNAFLIDEQAWFKHG